MTTSKNGFIPEIDRQISECFVGEKLANVSTTELKQCLGYVFQLIGLTKYPENEEYIIIDEYIRTTYPFFTINELRIAFKLAVQGKLECQIEHFERFSPKYISNILNAYKAKANEVRANTKPMQIEEKAPPISEDEVVKFTFDQWKTTKMDDYDKIFNASRVFDILYKNKKIQLNDEIIQKTLNLVKQDVYNRADKMPYYNRKDYLKQMKNEDKLELMCKKYTLMEYFKTLL